MTTNDPYPGARAVTRAVSLLKAFTDSQPEWGLSELAQAAGLNKTTTFRLLAALESEGLIARNPQTDAYRLGPEAIVLGGRALRANGLRAVSRAELEALAQETGETATLEVLTDSDALILDEVLSRHMIGGTPSIGTRWPAHTTSTGKTILAALPDDLLNTALPRRLPTPTDKSIADRETLRAELAKVRRQGYAVASEELEPGFVAIGAPVHDHNGQVIAAISVGGPKNRMPADRIAEIATLVKAAAERISKQLGHKP
jgi:DNA-binding IclR family transcriptional regulator